MALKNQPYLPLYVLDFMSDDKLRCCSAESTGVYIYLMCLLHRQEDYGRMTLKERQKLDEDNVRNFAVLLRRQMPFELDVIERSLAELIAEDVVCLEGDTLYQRRMVKDGEISAIRAEAGRKGGQSKTDDQLEQEEKAKSPETKQANRKQNKSKKTAKAIANKQQISEIENENEYESENESKETEEIENKPSRAEIMQSRFETFWMAYPRKSAKQVAERAWRKLQPSEELLRIMLKAIAKAKTSKQWTEEQGQFIPYPATWLNQRRWEDKDEPPDDFDPENPYADWREPDG